MSKILYTWNELTIICKTKLKKTVIPTLFRNTRRNPDLQDEHANEFEEYEKVISEII